MGVTGTNGKTTTARWLAAILNAVHPPVAAVTTTGALLGAAPCRSLNTMRDQLDLIRTMLEAGGTYAVLETTSEVLARGLAAVWPYRVGVFTNLTQDHLDAHGSLEHYFASKAQLFSGLPSNGTAIINGCDEVAPLLVEVLPPSVRYVTYGLPSRGASVLPLTVTATSSQFDFAGTTAKLLAPAFGLTDTTLKIPAIGAIYLENALAALTTALALGIDSDLALTTLATVPVPPGRFEVIHRNPDVIVDYAHTPDALTRTLATARQLCEGQLWLVFGAGGQRDRGKRPLLGKAAEAADHVILTSDNPRNEEPEAIAEEIKAGMVDSARTRWVRERRGAIAYALEHCVPGDLVLIAGKGHELEQVDREGTRPFSDPAVVRELLAEGVR